MMRHLPFRRAQAGFTLVEMLVVVTVLGILLSVAAPSFEEFIARTRLRSVAGELYGDLQYARSEAVQRNAPTAVTFDANAWCYVVHTAPAGGACTCSTTGASCSGGASALKTVSKVDAGDVAMALSNTTTRIDFEPRRGGLSSATPPDVRFSTHGFTLTNRVSTLGLVRLCAPSATSGLGVAAC